MAAIEKSVRELGVNTFPIPLGLKRDEANPEASKCIRCDSCDGYPCLVHAKSDADINCIRQILHLPNVTLMTSSRVIRLIANSTGTAVVSVEVEHTGRQTHRGAPGVDPSQEPGAVTPESGIARYEAGLFCLCAGAINSAVVLLASADDKHPRGLANRSDQVGRNFMYHQADAVLALSTDLNADAYTKTWGTNDFYLKDPDPSYPFPLGQVQPIGSFHHEMMAGDAPPLTPGFVLETMKQYAVPWWLTTEDLPAAENRVTLENTTPSNVVESQTTPTPSVVGAHPSDDTDPHGADNQSGRVSVAPPGRIRLSYTPNNVQSFERLRDRWIDTLKKAGHASGWVPLHAYFKKRIPLEGVGHQNGTCRMGLDPATSVLDAHCKAQELDNLYVVDAACFPSASAVNPSLTIIANALRVAEHLLSTRLN
jgi:choline dehydrogenase-like flavoprotein